MKSSRLGRRQFADPAFGRSRYPLAGGPLDNGKAADAAAGDAAANRRILRLQNDVDIQNLDPANRHGWYDELVMFRRLFEPLSATGPATTGAGASIRGPPGRGRSADDRVSPEAGNSMDEWIWPADRGRM